MRIRLTSTGCVGLFGLIGATILFVVLPSSHASPSGYAPHETVNIDGVTVPDIGPLHPLSQRAELHQRQVP
jgi:hypothetical protein